MIENFKNFIKWLPHNYNNYGINGIILSIIPCERARQLFTLLVDIYWENVDKEHLSIIQKIYPIIQ